ncbi:MAG: ErfK/YbiS/YcfS/YnhG family protein [Solirubrobacterales bacterium]|nr:ErfK/YbiS/YcfS/YnhG family protein [Solirubrobacterales bacterium]
MISVMRWLAPADRRGPLAFAACVLVIACRALLPAAAGAAGAPGEIGLSDERTLTTWAQPESVGGIYAHPVIGAARVAWVHLFTADGFPEVYMLLSSYVDGEGREWVRVRVPGRPNGRIGWMLRERLGSFHRTRWRIVVNRSRHRMRVYFGARVLRVFPVGVGKPSTPTPVGHFWIDERFKLSNPSNPYWPYALGTSDYSTLPDWAGEGVVGIHGPFGEPQKIPGDPSHGCIRMLAPDIAWLGPRVTLGTPVDVVA